MYYKNNIYYTSHSLKLLFIESQNVPITSEIMYLAENFLLTWSVFCFQIHIIFMCMKDNVFSQCVS